jgi:hypothetical protein
VELTGFEPVTPSLRKMRSNRSDQVFQYALDSLWGRLWDQPREAARVVVRSGEYLTYGRRRGPVAIGQARWRFWLTHDRCRPCTLTGRQVI